jgi:hypothetical protein
VSIQMGIDQLAVLARDAVEKVECVQEHRWKGEKYPVVLSVTVSSVVDVEMGRSAEFVVKKKSGMEVAVLGGLGDLVELASIVVVCMVLENTAVEYGASGESEGFRVEAEMILDEGRRRMDVRESAPVHHTETSLTCRRIMRLQPADCRNNRLNSVVARALLRGCTLLSLAGGIDRIRAEDLPLAGKFEDELDGHCGGSWLDTVEPHREADEYHNTAFVRRPHFCDDWEGCIDPGDIP